MAKFRKKPVVIEAVQWDGLNLEEVKNFVSDNAYYATNDAAWKANVFRPITNITIHTLEGDMKVSENDYIIKGVDGEFYPCKPDIFEKTYEKVEE